MLLKFISMEILNNMSSSLRAALVLGALMACYYYVIVVRNGAPRELYDFRTVSPEHYERVVDALGRFEEESRTRKDIHSLSAHRATVSKHLYELQFRLPNDTKASETLARITENKERDMDDVIQRIRKDSDKPLEFPYALGTYFMNLEPILLKPDQGQSLTYSTIS